MKKIDKDSMKQAYFIPLREIKRHFRLHDKSILSLCEGLPELYVLENAHFFRVLPTDIFIKRMTSFQKTYAEKVLLQQELQIVKQENERWGDVYQGLEA